MYLLIRHCLSLFFALTLAAPSLLAAAAGADDAAPADELLATDTYRLGPEDVVEVFVWREPDISRTVIVRPDGYLSVPLAGEIRASGRIPQDLQEEIARRLQKYIEHPIVTVVVKEINSHRIAVFGEVTRPDWYVVRQRLSVLDAIALAGGFTEFARRASVIVIRSQGSDAERKITVNIKAMLNGAENPFDIQPADVIYVR
ncbi:MAG: polysaccharide biosynthesis/export family protein [Candidatus Schekmanbacteria bacterium]|nr:polysaccharide biosynthesis/export family protein [Candidatus Schekmanbacteria bacterium]